MRVAGLGLPRLGHGLPELHGETAREMCKDVSGASKSISITNGVHQPTWQDARIRAALVPEKQAKQQDAQLWAAHQAMKQELIEEIDNRTGQKLSLDGLLIGFARRAAAYKRARVSKSETNPVNRDGHLRNAFITETSSPPTISRYGSSGASRRSASTKYFAPFRRSHRNVAAKQTMGRFTGRPRILRHAALSRGAKIVVSTEYGYHLFKVIEFKPGRKHDLAEVRGQVEARMVKLKQAEAHETFEKELLEKAKIWVNETALQAIRGRPAPHATVTK
jgi:hypothetical protein